MNVLAQEKSNVLKENCKVGLLEKWTQLVGCTYLSDLHLKENMKKIGNRLSQLDESVYSMEEWNDAASYLLNQTTAFTQWEEARAYILNEIEKMG